MESLESKIAQHGKSLVMNLYILVRITGIYDSMNETIFQAAGRLLADIESLMADIGELTIKIIEGTFYVEGVRIKATVSEVEAFSSLAESLQQRRIGMLDFRAPLQAEDLIKLAYAMKEGAEAADIQSSIDRSLARGITIGGPVILQREEEIDLKDNHAVAKRAYLKAVSVVKEVDKTLKAGGRLQLKKIKRALQLVVDSILADDSFLIGFTAARNYEHYHFFHSVNVAILAVALGNRLGMDRVQLRNLALAALFHDIGKLEIPLSILDKKTEFSAGERELIERHPLDGIKVFLRFLGLNEASILSMLVAYEHHMKLDLSGYPKTSGSRRLNVFSRIVSIADDFDSLVSGRIYGRKKLSVDKAMKMIITESGSRYDPALVKAFADVLS